MIARTAHSGRWRRPAALALRALTILVLVVAIAWASAALWFDGPAGVLAFLPSLACAAAFWRLRRFWTSVAASAGTFAAVLLWWFAIPPRNDRDWQPDVARVAAAEFSGSRVTVHNVRNFEYRSNDEFIERWETRAYDLDQVVAFDLFLSFWGPTLIAHTIAAWEFADGRCLAISIETRKEKGEAYSAVRGFFRQFELYYVVADERDLIGVRVSHRGEQVFLYRLCAQPDVARAVLVEYLQTINALAAQPVWYNALTHNCTTAIHSHFAQIGNVRSMSWKMLLNGYLDELLFDRGQIDTNLPFAETKRQSDVTERANAAGTSDDFSMRIRNHLPKIESR